MLGLCWAYICWPMWAPSWPCLGPLLALCWPMRAPSGPMLGLSWPYVGPVGLCWPHVGYLGAYVEAMLAVAEAISGERPPRCQFFRPGPLRGCQNHVKTTVVCIRHEKKWDRPRPRNTVNSSVFVTSHARSTVNYRRRAPPTSVLRCFVLFPFFPLFRTLWLKMGQHGPT